MDKDAAYHKQMVETKIWKLILRLGLPTTVSMLITNIYNLVDTYFVGTLGVSQQGATGILFTLQAIIQAFAFMLGHGSGTHVAKNLAIGDKKEASRYVSTAFYLGLAVGGILLTFGIIFLEPFMIALGSSETILPYAKDYGFWVLVSAPFFIVSLILNNNLRYEGKAFFAMIGIAAGAGLNVLGDFIFIRLMDMGVYGAGLSTAISQFVSFVLLLIFYLRFAQTTLHFKNVTFRLSLYLDVFKAGLPSLLRQGLASISGGILNNITKPFGDAAVAAISVVNRYSNFIMCVGLGIGQGLQPVAAYNYAVKQYPRVRQGTIFTIAFSSIVVAILSTITLFIPEAIVRIFNQDEEVLRLGVPALRFAAISLYFTPVSVVSSMLFQSVRKSLVASILSALRSGLAFIPTIFILVYGMNLAFTGVALSQPVSDILTCLITIPFLILFLRELRLNEIDNGQTKAANKSE